MRVARDGKHAVTHYRRLAHWADPDCTLLSVSLETGRTHQIRVHLGAIDRPIVGDRAYGVTGGPADAGRPWLHARRLAFEHPITGRPIVATAPLPSDLADSLAAIGDPTTGSLHEIDPGGRRTP
jgi:23S rRNA pseudouridine1911/1915/1917 synthase